MRHALSESSAERSPRLSPDGHNTRSLPSLIEDSSVRLPGKTPAESVKQTACLSPNELRRRLWHMMPGLLPFLLPDLRRANGEVEWWALCVIAAAGIGLSAIAYRLYDTIAREGERLRDRTFTTVTYGAMPVLLLCCFPHQPQLAALVLVVLAFGDGSATLFGLLWGRKALPWNDRKTWIGSAAFLLCSAPAAALAYWIWSGPTVSFGSAIELGGITAFLCMLVESSLTETSDNLAVSGTAAAATLALHTILFGWPG
jgi:phytol kinase